MVQKNSLILTQHRTDVEVSTQDEWSEKLSPPDPIMQKSLFLATESFLKFLRIKKQEYCRRNKSFSKLGGWYVHRFRMSNANFLLLVNEKSLFSFIMPGMHGGNKPFFYKRFKIALGFYLDYCGVSEVSIKRALWEHSHIGFRGIDQLGHSKILEDFEKKYRDTIELSGDNPEYNLEAIIYSVNFLPNERLNGASPKTRIHKLIRNVYDGEMY
ncbi:MAG: hypothetical protein HQK84_09690 [Nitrospinae bacterium]|nr:hypothetical protein [Nitrospinota bacterium]